MSGRKKTASAPAKKYYRYAARRPAVVTGSGDYKVARRKQKSSMRYPGAGKTIGSAIGSVFGPAGSLVGGALGNLAHSALHAITGFGDYHVKHNVLTETNGPPQVINQGKEFIIRHREYITDIYSSAGTASTPSPFLNQIFPINPGQATTFPWLASLAGKFEQYRVDGMVFEFKSLYSDAVVTQNGSIGSIILATEYNAGSAPFNSKQQMENYQFAQSCKPSLSVLHPIECARNQTVLSELYVRPSAVPTGEDIKTYDMGDFQIASQGIPLGSAGAPVNLGELWVTYQISLLKPKIPSVGPASYVDSGWSHFNTNNLVSGSFTAATPFGPLGSLFPLPQNNILGITFTTNSMSIPLTSTPMRYMIDLWWTGDTNVAGWNAPATGTITNGLLINAQIMTGSYLIPNVGGSATTIGASAKYFIECPAATGSLNTCLIPIQNNGGFPSATIRRMFS
ncbi:putative capsid protein [Fire ant associated circular virus 1]|uniref:Putative capsid protein n=1 Tax=Fire ant associated circular virus 1 TaxID=2293280 RepID=A0A346BPB1_9VIRU|nr:putative capsid protein [Fire ant associated circular virus 1]AXL65908.1 putative capsid protein [Fire ant associated circular virus 1]